MPLRKTNEVKARLYKLVIADDEYTIRRGLSTGIPWADLGFSVTAVLEDGDEVLEHLKINDVDVLLMDIRMSRVSGLDVAEYVSNEYPEIIVVLISGYRDFDYAHKAIEYGVKRYLLKPIQTKEMREVFFEIRRQLDMEEYAELKNDRSVRSAKVMLREAKALWLEELYHGIGTSPDAIARHIEAYYPDAPISIRPAKIELTLNGIQDFLKDAWAYGEDAFDDVLINALESQDGLEFYKMNAGIDKNRFICICMVMNPSIDLEAHLLDSIRRIRATLRIDAEARIVESYETLEQFARAPFDMGTSGTPIDLAADIDVLKKLLQTNLSLGQTVNANELITSMINKLSGQPLMTVKSLLIDVISTVRAHLRLDSGSIISFDELIAAQTLNEVAASTGKLIDSLNVPADDIAAPTGDTIELAVTYLHAHYAEDLSLASVAEAVYISRNYLSSQFKKKTGMGFQTYLTNLRIERAKELLKRGHRVQSVGQAVGYPDARYFARTFHRQVGQTPSEYAKGFRGTI